MYMWDEAPLVYQADDPEEELDLVGNDRGAA